MTDASWRDQAACRDADLAVFFPEPHTGRTEQYVYAEAVTVCRRCPVRDDCLAYALEAGEVNGVWGGHLPSELARLNGRTTPNKRWRRCVVCGEGYYTRRQVARCPACRKTGAA